MPKPETVNLDALLAEHVRKPKGTQCSVAGTLALLDPAARAKFEAAIADEDRYAAVGLADALTKFSGRRTTANTVSRHRRRNCLCP